MYFPCMFSHPALLINDDKPSSLVSGMCLLSVKTAGLLDCSVKP